MALSKKSRRLIKASVAIAITLLVFLVIVPYSTATIVLSVVFERRYATKDYLRFSCSDFAELQSQRYTFGSDGQKLVGYRYFTTGVSPKGLVILAHGLGGGGQNGYMDVSYYFVRDGYEVFAYDAVGNDESTGKVHGLPQGITCLNSAISYAKSLPELSGLPIVLWGHSWGGYSAVCSLKYNRDVKAVACISGFNRALDMIESRGVQYGGAFAKLLTPYVRSVERMRFGDYSAASGVSAIASSTAGMFIAHGTKDDVVPTEYGYDAYYSRFSSSSRVQFSLCDGKGHTDIMYTAEGWEYTCRIEREANKFSSQSERKQYIADLDREKLCSRLDLRLFAQISNFYDRYTQGA